MNTSGTVNDDAVAPSTTEAGLKTTASQAQLSVLITGLVPGIPVGLEYRSAGSLCSQLIRYSSESALLANMIGLRCSGNGNNAGRGRAGTSGYGAKQPIRCGPCTKGQAVNTLARVCGPNVFIFQAEGTFC